MLVPKTRRLNLKLITADKSLIARDRLLALQKKNEYLRGSELVSTTADLV